ncbi:MAG: tyrosine-type recombinase/integrase [Oscillospiraceae bacterium]|nr:tyrosine-type recombinase/integrase [Oscillospiraceae bacterium]
MNKHIYLKNYLSELPDFVFSYIQNYYDGESVNTQVGYCIDIRIFLKFLKIYKYPETEKLENFTEKELEEVTVEDLINFKAYLREYEIETRDENGRIRKRTVHNSEYGINRKLSAVRGLYGYLYKTDRISCNITDKITFANISRKIKKPLTVQETMRVLDIIYNGENYFEGRELTEYNRRKKRDIALFITYLGTGVRVSELINLDIGDICFETSSFIVTRKGGDEQEIFMPLQVQNEMAEYINERAETAAADKQALFIGRGGKRISVSGVEKLFKKYCYTVGITNPDKTRPHALRRTFACNLLEDGVDIKMVAELMGHKNIEVTHKFYAQYSSKARKEVMVNRDIMPKEEGKNA